MKIGIWFALLLASWLFYWYFGVHEWTKGKLSDMTLTQKIITGLIVAGIITSIVFIGLWLGKDVMVKLFKKA